MSLTNRFASCACSSIGFGSPSGGEEVGGSGMWEDIRKRRGTARAADGERAHKGTLNTPIANVAHLLQAVATRTSAHAQSGNSGN